MAVAWEGRLDLPVRQQMRPRDGDPGFFSTAEGATFEPVLDEANGSLLEDVAHFFRGKNPYNAGRTVTLCNGMYGRGTYGAVRALTDAKFRDRNEDYVRKRFRDTQTFSILVRHGKRSGQDVRLPLDRPVSRMLGVWHGEYEDWSRRDLSGKRYVYVWADGVYFAPASSTPGNACWS